MIKICEGNFLRVENFNLKITINVIENNFDRKNRSDTSIKIERVSIGMLSVQSIIRIASAFQLTPAVLSYSSLC